MCTFNDQTIISLGFTDYPRDNVWSSCKNHSTPDQQREGGWFVNDALFFKFFQDSKKTLFNPLAHNITSRYQKKKKRRKKTSSSSSSYANYIFLTLCLTRFQPGWKRINWESMRNWMRDIRYVSVIIKDLYQKEPFNTNILPI